MQALGSYKGGTLLFLGLGTGLGSALVVRGHIVPMELGHLSYKRRTYEDHVGNRGLQRLGKKKWRNMSSSSGPRSMSALLLDEAVIGGGNAKKLKKAPPGCRLGTNANAFLGGFRLWEPATHRTVTQSRRSLMTGKRSERNAPMTATMRTRAHR